MSEQTCKYFTCLVQKHLQEKRRQIVLSIIAFCMGRGLNVMSMGERVGPGKHAVQCRFVLNHVYIGEDGEMLHYCRL